MIPVSGYIYCVFFPSLYFSSQSALLLPSPSIRVLNIFSAMCCCTLPLSLSANVRAQTKQSDFVFVLRGTESYRRLEAFIQCAKVCT